MTAVVVVYDFPLEWDRNSLGMVAAVEQYADYWPVALQVEVTPWLAGRSFQNQLEMPVPEGLQVTLMVRCSCRRNLLEMLRVGGSGALLFDWK